MAGYIMTIKDKESLANCMLTGTYGTIMSQPNGYWNGPQEGTFADYLSMKPGDLIYFFCERLIFGIGNLINIDYDCKFLNFKNADIPKSYTEKEYKKLKKLQPDLDYGVRCFCTFKPEPYFFKHGVDMDDILSSNPERFNTIRTMWKVSFIKIDDDENIALRNFILKRNEENLNGSNVFAFTQAAHSRIAKYLQEFHSLETNNILSYAQDGKKIKHEMAIEAALCKILSTENTTLFGKWDYISHQVAASPFKPIDYMDKMDIFGYRFISGYDAISKYIVIEIKKDAAKEDVIDQIMKYVDWINQEYAHGDYSMIEAYVVAADFPNTVVEKCNKDCIRNFTRGYRPAQPCTWTNCKLVKYEYLNQNLQFTEIN